jgi:hypothetical protein
MNVFAACLDTREENRQAGHPDDWMVTGRAPEERLLKFDTWARRQLEARLQWPADARRKARQIEQCRVRLERMVIELWRRGWSLDGQRLAKHILAAIDDIGAAQRAGRVKDFWPFYCRVIDRYVGLNAEEIQTEARSLSGARSLGDVLGPLLQRLQSATLPDLIAQRRAETAEAKKDTLRSRLARQRAQEAARKAAASQPQLF